MGQQGPVKARAGSSTALYEALTALGLGDDGTAREAAARAVADQPADPLAWETLAAARLRGGDPPAAVEAADRALALNPDSAAGHALMGAGLKAQGRLAEAEIHLGRAVTARPDNAEAWRDLAHSLSGLDRLDEARDAMTRALALSPDDAAVQGALGALHRRAGWPVAAETASRRAAALDPDTAAWRFDAAHALRDQGRLDEAEGLYRETLDAAPDDASGHSGLLACLNYQPERPAAEIFAEYRRWEARHGRYERPDATAYGNDPSPERRLRVGYVSPDFREHVVRHVLEPLLSAHDRGQVEVFCYAEQSAADGATELLRTLADGWVETGRLSDEALAERIAQDRIDILVDFGGHGRAGRLPVFARRPAPVQLAHMLGGGYTSGLSVMDGFLGDAALAPAGAEALFAEPIIRLARIPLAYAPDPAMPEPTRSPAQSRGYTTYGSFGPVEAINAEVVRTWAEILKRAPGATLRLHARAFAEPAFRAQMLERFQAHDIAPEQVEFSPVSGPAAWAAHSEVDIVLDPFPHNADRSTIEALWLGVPVLSVLDRPSVGRLGASILGAVGLTDWVAKDLDDYVVKAVAAAHYPEGPAALRGVLRERFRASPLADVQGLARALEAVYRGLWRGWCAQGPPPAAVQDRIEGRIQAQSLVGNETPAMPETLDSEPVPPVGPGPATAELHRLFAGGDLAGADALADRVIDAGPGPDLAEGWHVKGLVALRRGDLATAQVAIEQSLALSSQASVWSNLGAVRRGAGRLVEAEAAYRAALALDPGLADARRNLVNLLAAGGRLDEAAVELAETAARAADPSEPLERLGDVLAHLGRAAEAADAYGRTLDHAPGAPGVRRKLALMLDRSGRPAEAADALVQALRAEPGDATAWAEFSDLQRRLGRAAEAEVAARKALSLDADSAAAFNTLGAALAVQDRWHEAGDAFEQALARDPDMAVARHNRDLALAKTTAKTAEPEASPGPAQTVQAPPAPADPRADHLKSLFAAGDLIGATEFAESVLAAEPDHPDAHHILGLVAYRRGDFAGAASAIRRSLAVRPDPHAWANLGASLRWVGDLDAAEAAYRRALDMAPELNDVEAGLAALLADRRPTAPAGEAALAVAAAALSSGDLDAAAETLAPALAADPEHVRALHLRGLIAFRQGRLDAAAEDVGHAVAGSPELAELRWDLSLILRAQGRLDEACAQGREAVRLAPHSAAAHAALGAALRDLGWALEAETTLHRALSLDPEAPDAWTHLSALLRSQGRAAEAETMAREAVRLNPRDASAQHQLGLARMDQDRFVPAADAFAAAVKLRPDFAAAHSRLLACLNHRLDLSPATLSDAQRVWAARHAVRLAPPRVPARRARASDDRLRIGYVSPGFRRAPAAALIEPVLAAHDRSQVEIVCYAEVAQADAVTERFRSLADLWRPTAGLSDEAVAQQVRDDGVDVLVDLAGHGEGARPLVFARRPAPVQLAWLALTGQSTGLSVMDATLGDLNLVPTGAETLLSEPLLRMKIPSLAWRPPEVAGPVTASPRLRKGWLTFAGLARGSGLSDPVLDAWAAILSATPGARLRIDHHTLVDEAARRALAARFVPRGVAPERLELGSGASVRGPWAAYGEVDIGLDAFPHATDPGVFEALWMGVPVVTLAGRTPGGRFAAAVLASAGLADWIASDLADYVARATAAAAHPAALARVRDGLRERVRGSGLTDAARLARGLEGLYRWFDTRRAEVQAKQGSATQAAL
jgi:predicted O-linked N-acetylglucosamine transferase (SPINDLY family)